MRAAAQIDQGDYEPNLYDAEWEETANPFGDWALLYIDDLEGNRYDDYAFGTRVDIYAEQDASDLGTDALAVDDGDTTAVESGDTNVSDAVLVEGDLLVEGDVLTGDLGDDPEFTGFVVERREYDQEGADELEVECYTFDQFLRGEKVSTDTSGQTLVSALQDIIENDTPITWNASRVSVGDPQTLTRNLRGEKVEEALLELAFKSDNETFGVDPDTLEFFWRSPEDRSSPRDISNTQWFGHDIPEEGSEAVNTVRVWYDGGDEYVEVDDGAQKLDQQESLDLPSPNSDVHEIQRPDITALQDAIDVGKRERQLREAKQTGIVDTFGLLDSRPGDTIDVTITPRGFDEEVVVAGLRHRWSGEQTRVTIIRKTGYQDQVLKRVIDSVERVELEGANRDGTENRTTATTIRGLVAVSVDVGGTAFTRTRFTNAGQNQLADGWSGDGNIDVATVRVGDDASDLSRSNTDLQNQTDSVAASETLDGTTGVDYDGSVTANPVREVGLFDSDDVLLARAVNADGVDASGTETATVELAVSNDATVNRAVLTASGQEAMRDVIADDSPNLPTQYAYGSGDAAVSTGDTALGSEEVKVDLEEVIIQSASTTAEFASVTDPADTDPARADSNQFEHLQECFHLDARNDATEDNRGLAGDSNYTDGQAALYSADTHFSQFEITPEYTIPGDEVNISYLIEGLDTDGVTVQTFINGDAVFPTAPAWNSNSLTGFDWYELTFFGSVNTLSDLTAGETHTIRVEVVTDDGGDVAFDRIAIYDDRYSSQLTFDNTVDGNEQISGPEFFANSEVQAFTTENLRRAATDAAIDSTWTDTSNGQFLELAIIDDDWDQTANSQTASLTVAAGDADTSVQSRVSLSRHGTATNDSPTEGRQGQAITDWELTANPDAIVSDGIGVVLLTAFVSPGDLTGTTISEAGELASDDTLLTRAVFADIDVTASMRVVASETIEIRED